MSEKKRCRTCHEVYPDTPEYFAPYSYFYKGQTVISSRGTCNTCQETGRQSPKDDYQRAQRLRKRKIIEDSKIGKACKYCGENNPVCLDYHHRDPSTKSFNLSATNVYKHKADVVILNEIAKCDLVCANCHRKIHANDLNEE